MLLYLDPRVPAVEAHLRLGFSVEPVSGVGLWGRPRVI